MLVLHPRFAASTTLLVATLLISLHDHFSGSDVSLRLLQKEREQLDPEFIDEQAYVEQLGEKLAPFELSYHIDNTTNEHVLLPRQFLHLHHMKTGGTSMDGLISCAMRRLRAYQHARIPYTNIHECSLQRYRDCRDGTGDKDISCRNRMNESAIMSYCAPLMDLERFGWRREVNDAVSTLPDAPKPHAVTVFRHPVDRVWSMFRFQTNRCYRCMNLVDVYAAIDAGNATAVSEDEVCIMQLLNHQTRNLVIHWDPDKPNDMIEDAAYNMKNFFTLVGLTENMNATAAMVGTVFPWMNETVSWSSDTCPMPHANSSPQNNRCGPDGTHWDLPPHPDEATRKVIEAHNQLDRILYEQGVQQFEYQKLALGIGRTDAA
jgi:hypothetical protein